MNGWSLKTGLTVIGLQYQSDDSDGQFNQHCQTETSILPEGCTGI